ncbi:PP2C family protein-serine/threonine phosphatase [Novosphingobium tardum]|jgi:serine/threonine protein phosphatase PrpC|uniref:PP2C family protein-serine/threonine phosphatase n=1 Tax=Novosphingobium tardum TaxID=1538021 RepID=A0ABV8RLS8_9SPHN
MTGSIRVEDFATTDVGLARAANEDSHVSLPREQAWLVADGMGGHENGQFASQAIVDAVAATSLPEGLEAACEELGNAVHAANARIFAASQDAGKMMGSTFVALVLRGDEFAVLWAGDSRAYLYRDRQLIPLTRDHSQVQELLDRGLLDPEDLADHPMRHILARAVGVEETLSIDAIRDRVRPNDLFLLSSDGLHGVIADDEIAAILDKSGSRSGEALVAACLARGAPDNVTVILVHANEPTLLALAGEGSA